MTSFFSRLNYLGKSLFFFFCLFFASRSFSQQSYNHTQLQNAFLTPAAQPLTALPVSYVTIQGQIINLKRYIKATLDMGDIYGLGVKNAWSINLTVVFTGRDKYNANVGSFRVNYATDQNHPKKVALVDFTSLNKPDIHHFDITVEQYTNGPLQTSAQGAVRFSLDIQDEAAYAAFGNGGLVFKTFLVNAIADPVPAVGQEVSKVKFIWKTPNPDIKFHSYDLQVLKVEPNSDADHKVMIDWNQAELIEIENSQTSYSMTLTEGTGYYFWRVRPIGEYYPGGRSEPRNIGAWSDSPADGPYSGTLFNFDAKNNPSPSSASNIINTANGGLNTGYFYYQQFNEGLNWSYNKTLTEGAQQTEVMTFANGLNQVNQVQTKLFSQNQVMATQKAYDYSGRPVLNSLPAPINKNQLGYKPDFFTNANSKSVSAADFDDDPSTPAVNEVYTSPALTGGAGTVNGYYSSANTLGVMKDFVPDAKGYPYSQTLYYSDPTGRVFKEAGAGAVMKLIKDPTGTHNLTSLYGSVAQEELDRVFGSEAPLANTTYKVTSIDPNHVNTVSYMSKAGQTLFTCLSDALDPANLDKVGSETAQEQTINDYFDAGIITPGDNVSKSTKTISVDKTTDIGLDYSLSPASFNVTCNTICYTCDYKVEISIVCPQEPGEATKNVKLSFVVPPQQLANCINTQTNITLDNLLTANNAVVSGPTTTVPANMLSILGSGSVKSKVTLDPGTYVFEKLIYVNNNDPLTGKPYLDARVQELMDKRSSWTKTNNCNCTVNLDESGFDCNPAAPVCTNIDFISSLFKFLKMEQESNVTVGGASVTYKSQLSNPPSGANYYSSSSPDDKTAFYVLINQMMQAPFNISCSKIQDCFNIYGGLLQGNISATGKINPNTNKTDFDNTFDLMQKIFACTGYNTSGTLGCAQYKTVIQLGQPGADLPGNIRLWYNGLNGMSTAPVAIAGVKDVEIPAPTGNFNPIGASDAVIKNNTCVNNFKFPSVYTAGLGLDEAGQKAWLAQHTCECVTPQNYSGPLPDGVTQPDPNADGTSVPASIVNTCKDQCDKHALSFMQGIHNSVYAINALSGFSSPADIGWKSLSVLYSNPDTDCLVTQMVGQCKDQCTLTSSQVDQEKLKDLTHPYFYNAVQYSNYAAFIQSPVFQKLVADDQLKYEQAMTWNSKVAPLGTYDQASEFPVLKDELLDFINKSFVKLLNKKNPDGDLSSAPSDYPVSFQSPLFTGSSNYVFNRDRYDFKFSNNTQGRAVAGVLIENVIWDKSNNHLLEINIAFYCSYSQSPLVKWSFSPTYPCTAFEGFGNSSISSLGDIVKFSFDKLDQLHAVLGNKTCQGTVVNTSLAQGSALGTFVLDATTLTAGTNVSLEIGPATDRIYLFSIPVPVTADGIQTASAIVDAINNSVTIPEYTASNTDANGNKTAAVTININASIPYDLSALNLYINENLSTLKVQTELKSLKTQLVVCSDQSVTQGVCPFKYSHVINVKTPGVFHTDDGKTVYDNSKAGIDALSEVLTNFALSSIENSIKNKVPSPLTDLIGASFNLSQGVAYPYSDQVHFPNSFPFTDYPLSSYSHSQSKIEYYYLGAKYTTIIDVIWDANGVIKDICNLLYSCSYNFREKTSGFKVGSKYNNPSDPAVSGGNFINDLFKTTHCTNCSGYNGGPEINLTQKPSSEFVNSPYTVTLFSTDVFSGGNSYSGCQTETYTPIVVCEVCMGWSKPSTPDFIGESVPVKTPTCEDKKKSYLENQLGTALDACLADRISTLKNTYTQNCLSKITDNFSLVRKLNNHHYTLYYYDRGNNLIKTVPPEGVELLSDADMTAVKNHRSSPLINPEKLPAHRLATKYTYNSLKQLVKQETPDGNITTFTYNDAGQMISSQDAEQAANKTYTFFTYDALGRMVQTGVFNTATSTSSEEISYIYTTPAASIPGFDQHYLRNRISLVSKSNTSGISKTYYSYDAHGNVEWLVQEIPGNGKKTLRYEYDVVSNKVNKVTYNENTPEQFIHKYSYDSDNRLVEVNTSTDGITWEKDAKYTYYLHGPLARKELGQDKLQGVDYTYTTEGYLKSINQSDLNTAHDPGRDANGGSNNFLADAFGMELGYYQNDYDRTGSFIGKDNPRNPYTTGDMVSASNDLFNGNISYWISNSKPPTPTSESSLKLNKYRYDKLNRLTSSDFRSYDDLLKNWSEKDGRYDEAFSYDGNGNLITLKRNAFNTILNNAIYMDELQYQYKKDGTKLLDNRLYHLNETIKTPSVYTDDIEDMGTFTAYNSSSPDQINQLNNYSYDKAGRLIKDKTEGLDITWNAYGKIASVKKIDNNYNPAEPYTITFEYDGGGNRISKKVVYTNNSGTLKNGTTADLRINNVSTFYVRDASGNVMAVYSSTFDGNLSNFTLDELPIYGAERIGEYLPRLLLSSTPGAVDNSLKPASISEPAALVKWTVPTLSGLKLLDFSTLPPNTISVPNVTGDISNTAMKVDESNNFLMAAYTSKGTNATWKLLGKTLATITPGSLVLSAATGENTAPVFVKNRAMTDQYYFIYPSPATTTGFCNLNEVEVNIGSSNGNGKVVSTAVQAIQGTDVGGKLLAINYKDGNVRVFGYSRSTDDLYYNIFSIDVLPSGIQAPVSRIALPNTGGAIYGRNDIVLSPDGTKFAMTMFQSATNTAQNDIVVMDVDPSCLTFSAPVYYKTAAGKAKHLCFSASGSYLYYSTDNGTAAAAVGRINLATSTQENVMNVGKGSVDIKRTATGELALNLNTGSTNLALIKKPEEALLADIGIDNTGISIGAGTEDGLPSQPITLQQSMGSSTTFKYSELNNWVVGAKSNGTLPGLVDIKFSTVNTTVTNVNPVISSSSHNVALAENITGNIDLKFFVAEETGVPYLFNAYDVKLSETSVAQIKADASSKSIFVQTPGNKGDYFLITGQAGQLYYHYIEKTSAGFVVKESAINKTLNIDGGALLTYSADVNRFGLAVYNDTRSAYANRLFTAVMTVAADGTKSADLYEHLVGAAQIDGGIRRGHWTANAKGTAEIGEIHISPNMDELTVNVTEQDNTLVITGGGGVLSLSLVDLLSVSFSSGTSGVAVGTAGTILKTDNQGVVWAAQAKATTNNLNQVAFSGAVTGYAVGGNGTILKTVDAGSNWVKQNVPTTASLNALSFSNDNTGLVVGNAGSILKTTDGGTSWAAMSSPTQNNLNAVHSPDANTAYAVGDNATILKSTNGGNTWTAQASPVNDQLRSVQFTSTNVGYALTAQNGVLKTVDGGTNWKAQTTGYDGQGLKSLHFSSGGTGYILGDNGLMLSSTDGGVRWTQQTTGTTNTLRSVAVTSSGTGFIGGDKGTILQAVPKLPDLTGILDPIVGPVRPPVVDPLPYPTLTVTYPQAYVSKLKRMGNTNATELVKTYNDLSLETELRRGLNTSIYVNQLPPSPDRQNVFPGIALTNGGVLGGSNTLPAPQNHKHSFKVFKLDPFTGKATYKGDRLVGIESVPADVNARAKNGVITFDYTKGANYLYFVQRELSTIDYTATASPSQLDVISTAEAATVAGLTMSKLGLNTGPQNYGLPLLPARIYQSCDAINPADVNLYSTRTIDKRVYELNDHLGDVKLTFKDYREGGLVLNNETETYAFGSLMPGRNFNTPDYRFGFNGKEQDFSFHNAAGQVYDFEARMYDARLGRFMSIDPLTNRFPAYSPYLFGNNNPILNIDVDGKAGDAYLLLFTLKAAPKVVVATEKAVNAYNNFSDKAGAFVGNYLNNFAPPKGSIDNDYKGPFAAGNNDGANTGTMTKEDVHASLTVASYSLKTTGLVLTAFGQPEGIGLYKVGDRISQVDEGIHIVEDLKNGNNSSALIRAGSIVAGEVAGNKIDKVPYSILNTQRKEASKAAATIVIDKIKEKAIEKTKGN